MTDDFVTFPGGWGKIKIKDHLSPAETETWAELGNIQPKNFVYK